MSFIDRIKENANLEDKVAKEWTTKTKKTPTSNNLKDDLKKALSLSKGQRQRINQAELKQKSSEAMRKEAAKRKPTQEEEKAVEEEWLSTERAEKKIKIDNPPTEKLKLPGQPLNTERTLRNIKNFINPTDQYDAIRERYARLKERQKEMKALMPTASPVLATTSKCCVQGKPGAFNFNFVSQPENYEDLAYNFDFNDPKRQYYLDMSKMHHIPGVSTILLNEQTKQPLKPVPISWQWCYDSINAKLYHDVDFCVCEIVTTADKQTYYRTHEDFAASFIDYNKIIFKEGIIGQYHRALDQWLAKGYQKSWSSQDCMEFDKAMAERQLLKEIFTVFLFYKIFHLIVIK